MSRLPLVRGQLARFVALVLVAAAYGSTRLPSPTDEERRELAARFSFREVQLPALTPNDGRRVRPVHPSLRRIAPWISSVGAGVALYDLDGDGLPNDLCLVDPRTDDVIVAPVPGTGQRFTPFILEPLRAPYDAETTAPMGCLPGDLDGDGRPDVLVYFWGRPPLAYVRTDGDRLSRNAFLEREVVATRQAWFTNAGSFADLDGDGHADLLLGNYFQDGARILDAGAPGSERMQHSMSRAMNGGHNRFLLRTPDSAPDEPLFVEANTGLPDSILSGWTLAIGAADLDGDLLPEVYVANDFGPDRLLHNRSTPGSVHLVPVEGRRRMATPASKVLGRDSFKGMGVDFADMNGDGRLDIYVSNIAAMFALEESHFMWVSAGPPHLFSEGRAPYEDASEPMGLSRSDWSWESRLGDFDNDGVPEALQATGFVRGRVNRWPELQELAIGNDDLLRIPGSWMTLGPEDDLSGLRVNPFFVRAADDRYYDLAEDIGLDRLQVSRGIATADVDGDGDLDFAVANQWEASRFYRNDAPAAGSFLGLHLVFDTDSVEGIRVTPGHPPGGTRPAVGAVARVRLPDGRHVPAFVDGGNGHSGKRAPHLHFGLGAAGAGSLQVELSWRGTTGRVHTAAINLTPGWHTITLHE